MAPVVARTLTGAATAVAAGSVWAGIVDDREHLVVGLGACVAIGVGWVIVWRDPRSAVGPALAWTPTSICVVQLSEAAWPGSSWTTGLWPVNLAGLFALLLVFPDGSRGRRLSTSLSVGYLVAGGGLFVSLWGTRQVDGDLVGDGPAGVRLVLGNGSLVLLGLVLLAAAASLFVAYRRGDERHRHQVRWLLVAGVVVVLLLVAGWVAQWQGASVQLAFTPFLAAIVVLVPASVGIAIVRHDLYDVDRVLSGTTTWVLSSVGAAAIFAVVVSVVGQALSNRGDVAPAVAAFVAALAFLPMHQFLAGYVARLVDRDRFVALRAVEQFVADVRTGQREPEEVEAVLRAAQRDDGLVVLLADAGGRWVDLDGDAADDRGGLRVEAGGLPIAQVVLGHDSARARHRVGELARAAWVALEVSRLRLALRRALADTRASRARIAEAAAHERRRLERDLHDGAQARLLATGMRLRLAQLDLPEAQAAEVGEAVAEIRATVDELRSLAIGVRPSRLDDGLAAALGDVRAASPLPFDLDIEPLPEVSDVRALTAYLVVTEAVANVLKHANASRIGVRVAPADGRLGIRVSDDGVGGISAESSLRSLRDRVASVGGELAVSSPRGRGTTIEAIL